MVTLIPWKMPLKERWKGVRRVDTIGKDYELPITEMETRFRQKTLLAHKARIII